MNNFLEKKLKNIGLKKISPSKNIANYLPCILSNNLIFVSGQLPIDNGKIIFPGKCDLDLTESEIKKSVELATINMFSNLNEIIINQKKKISLIKCCNIKGYLNCSDKFENHPKTLNYCSDMIVKVLGKELGSHSRTVIGVNSLPLNSPVEIDGVFSINF
jgi:enamine deaminase RidA (YjgF/YER057c/UK114 family)